jgi:2-pyrone-4,6-dicarboxylate lactonase
MDTTQPTYHVTPSAPKLRLPAGSCDTHVHVFGPGSRFPYGEGSAYTPPDAPKEKLFALHAMLGIERCVIVQSAAHGYDNSAAADAIAAKGGAYLGIALVPLTVSDTELDRLNAQGFRGARFNYMPHLGPGTPIEEVIAFSARLVRIGWHLQVHMDSSLIETLGFALKRAAVPVVLDHMGRVDASKGIDQPAFGHLRRLLADPKFLVKVSCSERASRQAAPYADAVPFARTLVAEFPDRALWGTDWPHPHVPGGPPDDGLLVDLLSEIAPTEAARQALLVTNPARFYGFKK